MRRSALALLAVCLAACGGVDSVTPAIAEPTPAVAERDLDAILFQMNLVLDDPNDPDDPPTYADSAYARFDVYPERYVGPLRGRIEAAWDRTPLLGMPDGVEWNYLNLRYLLARADTAADLAVAREEIDWLIPVALDSLTPRATEYWSARAPRESTERDSVDEAFILDYMDVEVALHCAFVALGEAVDSSAAPAARRAVREAPSNTKIYGDAATYLHALDDPALRQASTCGHRP